MRTDGPGSGSSFPERSDTPFTLPACFHDLVEDETLRPLDAEDLAHLGDGGVQARRRPAGGGQDFAGFVQTGPRHEPLLVEDPGAVRRQPRVGRGQHRLRQQPGHGGGVAAVGVTLGKEQGEGDARPSHQGGAVRRSAAGKAGRGSVPRSTVPSASSPARV